MRSVRAAPMSRTTSAVSAPPQLAALSLTSKIARRYRRLTQLAELERSFADVRFASEQCAGSIGWWRRLDGGVQGEPDLPLHQPRRQRRGCGARGGARRLPA